MEPAVKTQNSIEDQLKELYFNCRKHTLKLVKPLQNEDFVVQSARFVSPPKWHLAHTTWFFEEFLLKKNLRNYREFHPDFGFLFNSYYESLGDRTAREKRGLMTRPTVSEVLDYRQHVDKYMAELIPQLPKNSHYILKIGIQHEQQHQELLLTDIKYNFAQNPIFPVYDHSFDEGIETDSKEGFLKLPGGNYEIGANEGFFLFDNEQPRHRVWLDDFEISRKLETNGDYLKFIEDGGYKKAEFWHSDGWEFINSSNIDSPLYWHEKEGEWYHFTLAGLEKLNPDRPITHLSFYEAFAFAQWKDCRLPTEAEWETAAPHLNIGLRWEHTGSAYLPYPGYRKPEGAVGEYNGKFMVNQMVARGHSIATPKGHERLTYRNFFHPEMRWQFNGVRLCKKQ